MDSELKQICSVKKCLNSIRALGYCKRHYHQYVFMPKHPLYHTWQNIQRRCNNPEHPRYKDWGGRGIKVCARWVNSYKDFINDMGPRPTPFHQVDRINNDGDYTPENCRWATATQQTKTRRKRSNNRSGVKGVELRQDGKFVARITINKKRINLGSFSDLSEAKTARELAEIYYENSTVL